MRDDAGWLGALLAITLIGWALQPGERSATAHVPVDDATVFQNEVAVDQLGLPLPPGTTPRGRITRLGGATGTITNGRFTCLLAPAEAVAFYRQALAGQLEVTRRGTGGDATIHHTAPDGQATIRVTPTGAGSELFVVFRER